MYKEYFIDGLSTEMQRKITSENLTIIARVRTYNGGKNARHGEYIRMVKPETFKNGNIKRTIFEPVFTLKTIKKEHIVNRSYPHFERIVSVIVEL